MLCSRGRDAQGVGDGNNPSNELKLQLIGNQCFFSPLKADIEDKDCETAVGRRST